MRLIRKIEQHALAVLAWAWAKRLALACLSLAGIAYYVERTPLAETPAGQLILFLAKGLMGIVTVGQVV